MNNQTVDVVQAVLQAGAAVFTVRTSVTARSCPDHLARRESQSHTNAAR